MSKVSLFPPCELEEALVIARTIWTENAGKPMRRLTIFNTLGRSPESSISRSIITASSGYGLTQGSYAAEQITLTERGQAIAEHEDPQAMLDAVLGVQVFNEFFERYRGSTVPSLAASVDFLKQHGLSDKAAHTCYELILRNGERVALIQEISGTKRVVSPDHALEKLTQSLVTLSKSSTSLKPETTIAPSSAPTHSLKAASTTGPIEPSLLPSVHIDIQIHIAADASPDQIEQVFASMAKHLYKKE